MNVRYDFANNSSEDESSKHVPNHRKRHAEYTKEEIAKSQAQQEHVGHRTHPLILGQRDENQDVAHDGQHEDDTVQRSGQVDIQPEPDPDAPVTVIVKILRDQRRVRRVYIHNTGH